jgi:cell division protein FtsW (lipid II flippase)
MQGNGSRQPASRLWYLLLLPPYIAMIWVSSYNKAEPSFAGIPFFYWYQMLWIWLGSALTVLVHLVVNRNRH